ncbi:hypothetical protein DMC30DRAFT_411233 [Rhodotorula diobovata]|uniref:Calcineurin-like phosphoesterase domain-containing protein n=1 Tax=Rhodotorula diobovata TaxID=5288 RepID=A0A5C5FYU2_9BASI|nr:hypothetical protein DMC30DRAFT_411233 [Rhodotorula diobovata]
MLSPSSSRTFVRVAFLAFVAVLASLLTARYKLEETPYNRPFGNVVALGHQANQIAFSRTVASSTAANAGQVDAATGTDGGSGEGAELSTEWDDDEGEDEWDVWGALSAETATQSGWDPLAANTAPFTELQVKTCVLSPGLYDMCSPTSTAKEDAARGKWERIDRDVSKKAGIYYLYLYARRLLPGSTAPVITDLRLLDHRPDAEELTDDGTWVEVSTSVRDGVWPRMKPLFLHYKLTPQADIFAARKAEGSNGSAGKLEPITELDVLYGGTEVHPLPGFTKLEPPVSGGEDDDERAGTGTGKGKRIGASLAYRKEQTKLPPTPVLRFNNAGNFTVLQAADLHFSVGPGECRDLDEIRERECRAVGADVYSLKWLETALDTVKPDLVVLSGDQLNGQKTSWDARSVILKWAPLLWERNIPWTIVFGNHDEEETDLDHEQQMALMTRLPLFVGEAGPSNVAGVGNYVRSIRSPAAAKDDATLFNLYFLDSHANVKKLTPWGGAGYDYLKPDQINWFRGRSSQMQPLLRPYTPPRKLTRPKKKPSKKPHKKPSKKPAKNPKPHRPIQHQEAELLDDRSSAFAQMKQARRALVDLEKRQAGWWDRLTGAGADDGVATEVEPDDGSGVVENPDDTAEFEEAGDASEGAADETEDGAQGESNALLEAEEDLFEDEGFFEPTKLPDGPTALTPMEAKPNAMVFFHIPLRTAYDAEIDVAPSGKRLRVGQRLEGEGASKTDSGFFEQAILAQGELPVSRDEGDTPVDAFWDGEATAPTTGRPEVKVLAHGHCHISSDCRRVKGVWICFGGGATYAGYGNPAFSRRMRVYQLSDFGERIETYQLTDDKERVNVAMLYGDGSLEEQ